MHNPISQCFSLLRTCNIEIKQVRQAAEANNKKPAIVIIE